MNYENTFMKKCKGIALVLGVLLFGTAAIMFSATPAYSDPLDNFLENPSLLQNKDIKSSGKYQMSLSTVKTASNEIYWYVIVWDTETGRSQFYYGSPAENGTKKAGGAYNLPAKPL